MFVEMFDSFRKATEAATQMQQEMLKPWIANGVAPRAAATLPMVDASKAIPESIEEVVEQVQGFQKEWAGVLTEAFEKQRDLVDAQFELGIKVWKDAVQVALAKDPEQFRKASELFWKDSVEGMVSLGKTQNEDCQELAGKVTTLLNRSLANAPEPVATASRARKRG